MKQKLFLAICLSASGVLFAQQNEKNEQIEQLDSVQIDSKTMLSRKNSGKVVYQITSEDLEEKSGMSISQIVNQVSGIEINGSRGNQGQNLGYYVRGGGNRQVVIMIDGVQLNDPSQIANDYDLRLVATETIESIEIVKGASSVLYGSGASTAVISITSKKASASPIAATFKSTFGSNSSAEAKNINVEEFTNQVGFSGTLNKFFYKVDFSNRYAGGLSAIAAETGDPNFDEDVFNRYNANVNLGYNFGENLKINRFFGLDSYTAGYDDSFGYSDADFELESKQMRTGGSLVWKHKKGSVTVNDSFLWIERESKSSFPNKYDSRSYTVDAFANYQFSKQFSAVLGVNGNFSSFNSFSVPFNATDFNRDVSDEIAKFDIIDPYLNLLYISEFGLNVNAGARLNIHSDYGSHLVYNINPSYNFDFGKNNLKVLASYSTAYITPSLFQLYSPLYGNDDLNPEENATIEGGLEFTSENDLRISAVYFTRDQTNFVDFVTLDPALFTFQYQNISDEFTANGFEIEASKRFAKKFRATANYTNTQADDRFSLRIPEHKLNASFGYDISSNTYVGLNYQYNSDREDITAGETVVLSSYGLLGFTSYHQLTKNIKVFASVTNILNEEFEELYRYQARGRNYRLGVALNF
jgi:vitamin B12 transporter